MYGIKQSNNVDKSNWEHSRVGKLCKPASKEVQPPRRKEERGGKKEGEKKAGIRERKKEMRKEK